MKIFYPQLVDRRAPRFALGAVVLGFVAFTPDSILAGDSGSRGMIDSSPCSMRGSPVSEITEVENEPQYFAKVTPDGRYMCYIDDGNVIMDLKDPKSRVIVPGPYDPVPAPPDATGNVVVTVPNRGLNFYRFEDIRKEFVPGKTIDATPNLKPVLTDTQNPYNYQSPAVLSTTPSLTVYRVVAGSIQLTDYEKTSTGMKQVRQIDDLCGSGGNYRLPMLSKNGRMLSVFDYRDQTTKILGLGEKGECEGELLNLGFATGKVEFNYQNDGIVFHSDSYSNKYNGDQFVGVDSAMTKNVYTLEIKRTPDGKKLSAGKLRKLTNNIKSGSGSFYPSWTQAGEVVYVHGEPDGSGGAPRYSFRRVDPKSVVSSDVLAPLQSGTCMTDDQRKQLAALYALGEVWKSACDKLGGGLSAGEAAMWTLSLDPAKCKSMIDAKWNNGQILTEEKIQVLTRSGRITSADLKGLTIAALKAACPKTMPGVPTDVHGLPEGYRMTKVASERTPQGIFEHQCLSCHGSGQATAFAWDRLSLSQVNNMIIAIDGGVMPPPGRVGHAFSRDDELGPLIEELKRRKRSLEEAEQ